MSTDLCHAGRTVFVARIVSVVGVGIAALLASSCGARPAGKGATFKTPEEAAAGLVEAMRAEDLARLEAILGPEGKDLIHSGDDVADRAERQRFVELYVQKHSLEMAEGGASATLAVGDIEWPSPIPIVRDGDGWRFDTEAGTEEMLNRRIGRNELSTIQVCLAYVEAQNEYVQKDWDGDKILEYAQAFRSSPGKKDGLYWETKEGDEQSPLGEFAAQAAREGYGRRDASDEGPRPYFGYVFKVLKAQGSHAPGGAYDYMAREDMIGGCALLAHPAEYGASGIMSFTVSHDGQVYQKDLGEDTEAAAEKIDTFDPDETWEKVST
jgi:hypothetical protein